MNIPKPRSILKLLLKLAFTALMLYFVLKKIKLEELKQIFQQTNLFYIFIALILFFLSQVVSSWRLLSFLKSMDLHLKFLFNFRLYLLGMFYNIFLPGGIGGDGYKIYLLHKKYNKPAKQIFSALFFDRLSGLWAIIFLAACFSFFISQVAAYRLYIVSIIIIGTTAYYFIIAKYFKTFTNLFISAHVKSIAVQLLQLACVTTILLSVHHHATYIPYLFIFLLSSVVSVIPITIGGLGAREYVMIYASLFLNIDKNTGVFISSVFWVISALVSLAGAYYAYRSQEFKATAQETNDAAS